MNEKSKCGTCGSINTIGMSRIVGYYSTIEVWNGAKQSELKDRQQGNYKVQKNPTICPADGQMVKLQGGSYDVKSFDQDTSIIKLEVN